MSENAIGPFVVTADDGRMFHCSLETVGRDRQRRWVFRDSVRAEYVGPLFRSERDAEDIQGIVARWWEARQALEPIDQHTLMLGSSAAPGDP